MGFYETYSQRQKRLNGAPDVFVYDEISDPLRNQILWVMDEMWDFKYRRTFYDEFFRVVSRSLGLPLVDVPYDKRAGWLRHKMMFETPDIVIDIVELFFRFTLEHTDYDFDNGDLSYTRETLQRHEEGLNAHFRQHGVGYEIVNGEIIRVDSKLIHREAVMPALTVLHHPRFKAAEKEFLEGYEHYRHGRYESAIQEALKSFESVLKVIFTNRGWRYEDTDPAKKLVGVAYERELVPSWMQSSFTALRGLLEGGTPTLRNRSGGHGAGATPREVPRHLASYMLHQTASVILFLAESDDAISASRRPSGEAE